MKIPFPNRVWERGWKEGTEFGNEDGRKEQSLGTRMKLDVFSHSQLCLGMRMKRWMENKEEFLMEDKYKAKMFLFPNSVWEHRLWKNSVLKVRNEK